MLRYSKVIFGESQYCPHTFAAFPPTLSVSSSHIFSGPTFSLQFDMVCRNLCERLHSKIIFGKSQYELSKKYCRRCEVYCYHNGVFCPCCGMALRMLPTNKRDKERLRQLQLRREEGQDRIIRPVTLHHSSARTHHHFTMHHRSNMHSDH